MDLGRWPARPDWADHQYSGVSHKWRSAGCYLANSFAVGTVLLFALACALRLKVRVRVPEGQTRNPFWMWLGGPLGACYVTLNALLVPVLGTGTAAVATLAGMISLSLIVDKFGISRRRSVLCAWYKWLAWSLSRWV
nr:DMT family transporter [Rothia nasisuis]